LLVERRLPHLVRARTAHLHETFFDELASFHLPDYEAIAGPVLVARLDRNDFDFGHAVSSEKWRRI